MQSTRSLKGNEQERLKALMKLWPLLIYISKNWPWKGFLLKVLNSHHTQNKSGRHRTGNIVVVFFKPRNKIIFMASQTWQKWHKFKITYRVSVINVWDWEVTMWDWKITTWVSKITLWETEITIREWKTVMRDHNYQSRTKKCHTRFTVTVENEKLLYEKKNSPFENID